MKHAIFLVIAILFSLHSFSQETTNTIDYQFRTIYKNSNNYQEYKVMLKSAYGKLHTDVLDSLKVYSTELTSKNTLINSQKATIEALEKENKETVANLKDVLSKENSIGLFGIQLSKGMYSFILFAIILLLLASLGYYIYMYNNSNVFTVAAKNNLDAAEEELNIFKKKALEKEQKLRRQLQDEIIKNRNSN
jgi:hypothetical protein